MVRHDAISLAAYDTVRAFANNPRFEVVHLGCACDFPDITHRTCYDVADLLLTPEYQAADVAIFHFGIHHGLFDALLAGGPRLKIVRYHSVTPARFVAEADRPVIERSLRQIDVLRRADEVWADSPSNARELLARGFDADRLRVIPLVVEHPVRLDFADKPSGPVNVLYLGRIAPAKGLHDLLAAVGQLGLGAKALQVTIAGNTAWSHPSYLASIHGLIARHGLSDIVHFQGTVDDAARDRLLHAAHILAIPSYHEGFCRPVAEGHRAGCIPVAYDSYNLPNIVAGLGRVVPAGDVSALAAALAAVAEAIPVALEQPETALLPLDSGPVTAGGFAGLVAEHVDAFRFDRVGFQMRQRVLRLALH